MCQAILDKRRSARDDGLVSLLRAVGWTLLGIVFVSCAADGHALVVDLRTDLRPAYDFNLVRVTVNEAPDPSFVSERRTQAAAIGDDYMSGQRVAELRGVPVGAYLLTLELLDGGAAVVATRRVRVELERSRTVTVVITSDCFAVSCPGVDDDAAATECVSGRCVSPGCSAENPELCGGPRCATDTECGASTVACVASRCVGGECFVTPDDERCAADSEYCDITDGCQPIPSFPDAGPVPVDAGPILFDAGPRDAGGGCVPSGCDDFDPCTLDGCAGGLCSFAPLCDSGSYCVSGTCNPLPTFRVDTSETFGCIDVGRSHTSPRFLWRRVVTGRPGATATQFNQHAGCGEAFVEAESFVLDGTGSHVDESFQGPDTNCDSGALGRYRAYVEIDGERSPTIELSYFNSGCSAVSSCASASSYCPPCRDCRPGLEYCYASSSCAPNPTFTIETSEGPGCIDLGRDHLGASFAWRRTVTGRPGATATQINDHVSCGTGPAPAETIPLDGAGRAVTTSNGPASSDCSAPYLGRYRAWVDVDGVTSPAVEVTYFNSTCTGVATCVAARTFCP
jgi:hypothetical protein